MIDSMLPVVDLSYPPMEQLYTILIIIALSCKGTYASVRPYRHTYGNYGIRLQTWTRVMVKMVYR